MDTVIADFGEHWQVYVTMPFIAALIGYVTKRVAIEMMFRPLEFVGVKPFLGWQGVLPAIVHQPTVLQQPAPAPAGSTPGSCAPPG